MTDLPLKCHKTAVWKHAFIQWNVVFFMALSTVTTALAQKLPEKKTQRTPFNYPHLQKSYVSEEIYSKSSFTPRSIKMPDRVFPEQYYHTVRPGPDGFPLEMNLFLPYENGHLEKSAVELAGRIQTDFGHDNTELFSWRVEKSKQDRLNHQHLFLREYYRDIPIYNNEAVLHAKDLHFYYFNAQWRQLGEEVPIEALLSEEQALDRVKKWFQKEEAVRFQPSSWVPEEANTGKLWIYILEDKAQLVWKFSYMPDPMHRWEVLLDATDGQMVEYFENMCSFYYHHDDCSAHDCADLTSAPPSITSGTDLNGVNRNINTFQIGGVHYMLDATKNMFNASASSLPNDPAGAIWTINANGGFPGNASWAPQQFASNSVNWNNPSALSAHYNAGRAYDYFEQVFGRNSINGRGGNVLSFVDVRNENGSEMDNAFWNGIAIFYGNGNFAFQKPLASALDVAGHEMSHGVIQNTTNLEYRNESGALNESFADVFGVMIDRDDWLVGEEVVNPAVFRGGALRSMEDPHNGGSSLSDPGYQPRHYDERYRGSDDNGGVHINSGIPNFAFFKLAQNIGKSEAERIFYRALTVGYLTRSSQFIDFRSAIARAARDLFGAAAAEACHRACDEVGIPGSPNQGGNDYQNDLPLNPGDEFLIASDPNLADLYLLSGAGDSYRISQQDLRSKPSVTDNGREVVYVGADNRMHYVFIDYSGPEPVFNDFVLESTPQWSYAAFSKDGSKLAAVRNIDENILFVYDFISERWQEFELFNPSFTEGISTGEVRYADVLEWDYSGEYIMYDAFNTLFSNDGNNLSFWDIGFIKVWDRQRNDFTDGRDIQKLFTALDEGVSVGNPSFSKNSPHIVAFDYIDESGNYLVASNMESREVNFLLSNDQLFYPNYNQQDNLIAFDVGGFSSAYDINALPLEEDKISSADRPFDLVRSARWGVFLSAGDRDLTDIPEEILSDMSFYPNPASDEIYLESHTGQVIHLELRDLLGRLQGTFKYRGGKQSISVKHLKPGWYNLRARTANGGKNFSFVKK